MPEKRPGNSQGLSREALARKRARDLAAAKTPDRTNKRSENQSIGQNSTTDLHHASDGTIRRTSIAYNRATHSRGEVA